MIFCGTICKAAKQMGILIRDESCDGSYQFNWYDPLGNVMITCDKAAVRTNALELACHRLVEHIKYANAEAK